MSFIENKQLNANTTIYQFYYHTNGNIKWAKNIGLDKSEKQVESSLLFLSIPIFLMFTTIFFPDAILVLMLFLTSYCFFIFIKTYDESEIPFLFWYLSVIFFALACISKYNAIVYGAGVCYFPSRSKTQSCFFQNISFLELLFSYQSNLL